jgi:hypothetical protein
MKTPAAPVERRASLADARLRATAARAALGALVAERDVAKKAAELDANDRVHGNRRLLDDAPGRVLGAGPRCALAGNAAAGRTDDGSSARSAARRPVLRARGDAP